ncbi:MAG: DUF1684 domain-containing protein [Wenzhouxiangellaceae bacterium]|nr:DUF1684 domain-containing protein [Wenzhouxiangellaceae bacterium]
MDVLETAQLQHSTHVDTGKRAGHGRRKPIVWMALLSGLLATVLAGCDSSPQGSDSKFESADAVEALALEWRKGRMERLTEPYGWLSLTGLILLDPGAYTLGSADDSDIVLARGPASWGRLVVDEQSARFERSDGAAVTVDGQSVDRAPMLLDQGSGPTLVEAAGIRIHLVDPGGRLALRVRDPESRPRTEFTGLDYYEIESQWRIEAAFHPHPEGSTLQVANVMGQLIAEPNPGQAVFEKDGQSFALEAIREGDRLFFIFADRTSGRETYGLGRFLYTELPQDGTVVLDFNQTFNPPCAFNSYTSCSLPPQSNRIDTWIRAGEKRYSGKPGI